MEILKLAAKRHSVRKQKDAAAELEKIDMILEAGRIAPTGEPPTDRDLCGLARKGRCRCGARISLGLRLYLWSAETKRLRGSARMTV